MHLLSYRGMVMRIIQSLPHVRTPELDESRATYKWTRWDLSFIVTLEQAALSAIAAVGDNTIRNADGSIQNPDTTNVAPSVKNAFDFQVGNPGPQAARMPVTTDAAIRRFLEYPRGKLIVQSLGIPPGPGNISPSLTALQSPAPGSDRDANNGPFCKVNSIQEVAGESLWQIHLTFTTYIYEDSLGSGSVSGAQVKPPVLISNRWAVTTDTNDLHLTDRIVDGIVHFRADQLFNNGQVTDAFRSIFAGFSVPSGFKRITVRCVTLPQGNMVRYHIVDREQPYQQTAFGGQVRLEYIERSWMWRGSAARVFAGLLKGSGAGPIERVLSGLAGGVGPAIEANIMGAANVLGKNLPKRYKTIIAKAWGDRRANRALIVSRAMGLAQARMGQPSVMLPFTNEMSVSYHSSIMMAQVEITINWSFNEQIFSATQALNLAQLIFGGGTLGVGDLGFAGFAGADGDAPNYLSLQTNSVQPIFPNQNQTHGTWPGFDPNYLAVLATQTLETIGSQPANPP